MSDVAVFQTLNHNITVVNDNISRIQDDIRAVGQQVEAVSRDHATTHERLEILIAEFHEFVEIDQREKRKQFAQTKLMEIRDLLQKEFGHHDTVRRHATGILQATDAGLVREDTIHTAAEELLLDAPGYWLAPGLVALSAWVKDDRTLADKAVATGLKANTTKFSLFFALVSRRAGRSEPCCAWLAHYFQLQDGARLNRDVVVMIDAMANGVFGGSALARCSGVIDGWLEDLEADPGFLDRQRVRWAEALKPLSPQVEADCYPTLRKYSATWPGLEDALAATRRNEVVLAYFKSLFEGEVIQSSWMGGAIDGLLTKLVTEYDEAELPLKRQELHWQSLVEEDGDTDRANQHFDDASQALEDQTDFAGMLTNAAMHPAYSGSSLATRRYAVGRSKDWIVAGFSDLVAEDRAAIPQTVEIEAGSWKDSSSDGSDEASLAVDLNAHYANRITAAVNAVAITAATWLIAGGGALFGILILFGNHTSTGVLLALLFLAGGGGYFFFKFQDLENARTRARSALEKERDSALAILRAALAELVDLRREVAREDGKAAAVVQLLESVASSDFVIKRADQSRQVLT